MPKIEFKTLTELREKIGQEIIVGDWFAITQERVNLFADATDDHQWIHIDPTRAAAESPFHSTVAHGFLTLSLLPHLMSEALTLPPSKLTINYGLNRVRFTSPVRVGQQIRLRITLLTMEDISGGVQLTWKVIVELEGSDKPAETISRRYDN
jgi:acyl dehydratase